MPAGISAKTRNCALQGDWAIGTIAEQLNLLTGELDLLLEADPRPSRVEIDLAGITGIDACGCQLLTLFRENLKACGIAPELCRVPPEVADLLEALGFADPLEHQGAPGKEPV